MFDERDPKQMPQAAGSSGATTQSTGASVGSSTNPLPVPPPPAAAMSPGARKGASKRPIGTRIVDMTKQVFAPSRIQPKPDIALEYFDLHGKPAPHLSSEIEREFLDDVAAQGVKSIRIGYTTNGQHADNSNHYRGQAADIDMINGQPVNMYNKDPQVKAWVDSIVNRFNARHDHEVFGPGNQLYRDRNAFEDAELAKAHKGHIHWARRR
jgi:hypothetical protein